MEYVPRIVPRELKERLDRGERITLIDTRNRRDWAASDVQLPGALRLHFSEMEERMDEVPRRGLVVTDCT